MVAFDRPTRFSQGTAQLTLSPAHLALAPAGAPPLEATRAMDSRTGVLHHGGTGADGDLTCASSERDQPSPTAGRSDSTGQRIAWNSPRARIHLRDAWTGYM